MKTRLPWMCLLLVFMVSQGCYRYTMAPTVPPEHKEHLPPATDAETRTLHAFFWGLVEQNLDVNNCEGNGLAEVTTKTNLGFALVSVLTLGIWVPMQVEWRCAKDEGGGEIGMGPYHSGRSRG